MSATSTSQPISTIISTPPMIAAIRLIQKTQSTKKSSTKSFVPGVTL